MKKNQKLAAIASLALAGLTVAAPTFAALPAIVGTSFTAFTGDYEDLMDLVWALAIPIAVGWALLGAGKKAIRRAS